jgi:hypothetical protein
MAATRLKIEVWYVDDDPDLDAPLSVWTDQRDMAAFEGAFKVGYLWAMDNQPATLFRWITWHALRRTGQLDPPDRSNAEWDKTVIAAEADLRDVPAVPTNQDQSGETS